MKLFIIRLINRLFPSTRNIHFCTPDNLVSSMFVISHNKIIFFWLKDPIDKESALKKFPTAGHLLDGHSDKSYTCLHFYTEDSVDRFIEHLKRVKLNIQLNEAGRILAHGGTMEYKWENDTPPEWKEGEQYKTYNATIEFKMPETKQP